ncbi:hypothetical protein Tco_0704128 [Tanacetum coccineum]|uniref:Uncharacterized protein n=1 Tax=Tanacetum coccineum TaxID=301880 RepID=A0ABQ4Y288_9ASTR
MPDFDGKRNYSVRLVNSAHLDADVDNQPVQRLTLRMRITSPRADECEPFDSMLMMNRRSSGIFHGQFILNRDEHKIHNKVKTPNVIDSRTSVLIAIELKIYKEQVAIYEQRAKFELTEREQRMDDQMRMLIQNHNKTEEILKKELNLSAQLNSTMENNKIIEETVTTLKQEFKQKESKFLTDFSNLKHLNDKLENKLHSQDQSIQTVHMIQAKKAQPALYDGDELLKPHHVPVMVPSSEEELELAEATRNKLHVKMNDSACVEKRVNVTPPNYSKENFMANIHAPTDTTDT